MSYLNPVNDVETLTIAEVRQGLRTLINSMQENCGDYSPEAIEMYKILGSLEEVVNVLNKEYYEFSTTSFIPKELSFKEYLSIKEGD